jgi:SAM-dependent methyltransferase
MADNISSKEHWDKIYSIRETEQLGWYETDLSPSLKLIDKSKVAKTARILVVGAGSTTLIDHLYKNAYSSLIASDISEVALSTLKKRNEGMEEVECIVDDLTDPKELNNIEAVDMWIDRAVLHFFLTEEEQLSYFNLLKKKVKKGGFVMLAQFSLEGATKCSGLPIVNYSTDMFQDGLGSDFELIEDFNYTYFMPGGDERPYIYALFKRKK